MAQECITIGGHPERMQRVVRSLRVALIQLQVTTDREANVTRAVDGIRNAAKKGAELVVLPEIWNGPYSPPVFPQTAEKAPVVGGILAKDEHPSLYPVWAAAKECKVALIAGSIAERGDDGCLYNSSVVFSAGGDVWPSIEKFISVTSMYLEKLA